MLAELGIGEADAALIIDNIPALIDQETTRVHRPVELICELTKLVC